MNIQVLFKILLLSLTSLVLLFLSACTEEPPERELYVLPIPAGFPEVEIPVDNLLTEERIALGKRLFYDVALSRDSSISCASCHKAELAFSDDRPFSLGVEDRIGFRNAPSLANVAYLESLLKEGGVPTLEMQVLVPIEDHREFDFNMFLLTQRLQQDIIYVQLSQEAYGRVPDAFVISRALAAFQRTLISGNSAYDQFTFQGKMNAMTTAAKRGLTLFESEELKCNQCHSGFNFTNNGFSSNGLYEVYPDSGRARLTSLPEDRGVFKIPSLRNVELTAPYMFDGSFAQLETVIDHYASGGLNHINKSPFVNGFTISDSEKADLLAFLESLTDDEFVNNPNHRP